ncbi:hypothetical protein NPIL_455191 [Nephila pilipes]|uniref:Uncharacterized protein n=1 Tax=Nephila pilipes TaxID=299642 RepID=A0A8X6QBG8_NEPPI|nr:hypothetical protein NPIL_455191 [Nephila pilipes]
MDCTFVTSDTKLQLKVRKSESEVNPVHSFLSSNHYRLVIVSDYSIQAVSRARKSFTVSVRVLKTADTTVMVNWKGCGYERKSVIRVIG